MTEATDALLPCPFCGEAAKHSFNSLYGDMSMARCKSCGATAYAPKWNRRAVLAKWGQPAQAADSVPAPAPPPECETEAEKRAFAFGWFKALKFYARRDKKATVTLLFPGHEAADAWVRGIKGGQHVE